MELDIFQIIWQSGWVVKLVLISLILASVVSLSIVWKKRNNMREVKESNELFLREFKNSTDLKELFEKTRGLPDGPLKLMFQRGFLEIDRLRGERSEEMIGEILERYVSKFGLSLFSRSLEQTALEANERLDRYLSTLASIGAITPFVGLFGTVWGIIDSFTGLASGGNSLDAVAPGIAEALVATAVGLFAAIPAVWFYNYFSNENSKVQSAMDSFSKEFLNSIERILV
ncbi:MAG: MotA/TolQ/ExbB proton channel family protein [Bacteriovoracales bacterium]|nr:MotA/TolQ/ExbB proton channel family protein [Bacteriovoracales bacterium]